MKNLREILINRLLCSFSLDFSLCFDKVLNNLDYGISITEDSISEKDGKCPKRDLGVFILLLISFENDKLNKKKLLNAFRGSVFDKTTFNEVEYFKYICEITKLFIKFLIENCENDTNSLLGEHKNGLCNKQNNTLKKYMKLIQYFVSDIFDTLLLDANNCKLLDCGIFCFYFIDIFVELDYFLKNMIILTTIYSANNTNIKTIFDVNFHMKSNVYIYIDQNLLYAIISSLIRTMNIMVKYCKIENVSSFINSYSLDKQKTENSNANVTGNIVYFIIVKLLSNRNTFSLNKELTKSLGTCLSYFFIINSCHVSLSPSNRSYFDFSNINTNIQNFIRKNELSKIGYMSLYRGVIISRSLFNNSQEVVDASDEIFDKYLFTDYILYLKNILDSHNNNDECLFAIQSISVWTSNLTRDLNTLNRKTVLDPCFNMYISVISNIIISFLDQHVNYYLKSVIQLLEAFVELIFTLDYLLEGSHLVELNSDVINWLIKKVLNRNWNNIKYKHFFLERILSRIVISSNKNKSLNYLKFGKLSSLDYFKFHKDYQKLEDIVCCDETNFLFCLVYSLSIQNISSSSFNLIVTWYRLFALLCKFDNSHNYKTNGFVFLDFVLAAAIDIVINGFKFGYNNTIDDEGKLMIFKRVLEIFKVANKKYYTDSLPLIFDLVNNKLYKCKPCSESNFDLNPFLAVLLPELRRNGVLFWENCTGNLCDSPANNLNLVVDFNKPNFRVSISVFYLIESVSSFNSEIISSILDLALPKARMKDENEKLEHLNLLNELELLFMTISKLNTIGINKGVYKKLLKIIEVKFDSTKRFLLYKMLSLEIKQRFYSLLGAIFNHLFESLGLHISYDKAKLSLEIFSKFIETFYEDEFYPLFYELICDVSSFSFSNIVISKLQTLLFSTSEDTREYVANIIFTSAKFKKMFCEFHFCPSDFEFKMHNDIVKFVINPLILNLRPREYKASNIVLLIYLQKIMSDKNGIMDSLSLLKDIFDINDINKITLNSNININLIIMFNNKLYSRINNYLSKKDRFFFKSEGEYGIPLHCIVYMLGICYKLEIQFLNSVDFPCGNSEYNSFLNNLLESIYLLIVSLAIILEDTKNYTFRSVNLQCGDSSKHEHDDFSFDDFEYQILQTIDETSKFFRITIEHTNMLLINFKNIHVNCILHKEFYNIKKELSDFIDSLNISILSGDTTLFVNIICTFVIQHILTSDHPGNSNFLQELFLIFSSYSSYNRFSFKFQSIDHIPIDNIKVEINTNYEFRQYIDKYESSIRLNKINSPLNKEDSHITENIKDFRSLLEIPKIWILSLVHSIIFCESKKIPQKTENINTYDEHIALNTEAIDNIFHKIIFKSGNNHIEDMQKIPIKYEICDIIKIYNREYFKIFEVPSPKRNSVNLSNVMCTMLSLIIRNTDDTYFVKSLLKVFIIISMSSYNQVENCFILHNDDIYNSFEIGSYNVHFNNVLAFLINKSKVGTGSSSLFELFDTDILCGLLISALTSIKIYNFRVENTNRFTHCNSSLNLMSSLIKRFSFEPFRIEHKVENSLNYHGNLESKKIKNDNNYVNFKDFGVNIFDFYNINEINKFKKKHVNYYSVPIQNPFYFCYSLNFMKKNTDAFDSCVIESLLNSNQSQFQGMTLLFLSEISISWFDCSQNMILAIIKTIYSPSYFIRSYSARLLTNIILKSMNEKNVKSLKINNLEENVDEEIFNILSVRLISTRPRKCLLIYLIHDLIVYSISCKLAIKYNLLHGTLLIGIALLRRPNVKLILSIALSEVENANFCLHRTFNLLLNDQNCGMFKNNIIRTSKLYFISLLLDLEFDDKIKFELEFKTQLYLQSHFQGTQINISNVIMNYESFFQQVLSANIVYSINCIHILISRAIKIGNYNEIIELSNILFTIESTEIKKTRFIHPKVLFEFYSTIQENFIVVPENDLILFLSVIVKLLNFHMKFLYDFFICLLNSNETGMKFRDDIDVIFMESIRVIVEFTSFLAMNERVSEAILLNSELFLDIDLHLKLTEEIVSNYNPIGLQVLKSKLEYENMNHSKCSFKDDEFVPCLLIIYVRFYPLSSFKDFEYITTLKILNCYISGLFLDDSQYNYLKLTKSNKLYLCSLEEVIFSTINNEFSLFNCRNIVSCDLNELKNCFNLREESIAVYFLLNKNCWYSLMLSFILLSSDEIIEIRLKCQQIFCRYSNVIKYFSNIICGNPIFEIDEISSRNNKYIINSIIQCSNNNSDCISSMFMIDSLSKIMTNHNDKEIMGRYFPKEVENIHNEYVFILKSLFDNISEYLMSNYANNIRDDQLLKIEFYLSRWEKDIINQSDILYKIERSFDTTLSQLYTINLFGNILINDISIYLFLTLFIKCKIIMKFGTHIEKSNGSHFVMYKTNKNINKIDLTLSKVQKNLYKYFPFF